MINTNEIQSEARRLIALYGKEHQLEKLKEEIDELYIELIKYVEPAEPLSPLPFTLEKSDVLLPLTLEMLDVLILIFQLLEVTDEPVLKKALKMKFLQWEKLDGT